MGALGGLGLPPALDMNTMIQTMQQPAFQAAMDQLVSTPGMMDSIVNMNPQLRRAVDADPGLRCAAKGCSAFTAGCCVRVFCVWVLRESAANRGDCFRGGVVVLVSTHVAAALMPQPVCSSGTCWPTLS
jgi:hypothetical protein